VALFSRTELETWQQSGTITDALYNLLHASAVGYLEDETGVRLTRQTDAEVTYTPRWDDCWITLPVPTVEVSEVEVDGDVLATTEYQWHKDSGRLYRHTGWGGTRWVSRDKFAHRSSDDIYTSVKVTLTYGFADGSAPAAFKTWGLVLAAQAYKTVPNLNLQSFRIDDYAETFATGGALVSAGISLPPQVLGSLKRRYGQGAAVVEAR
jgi:hypothetical protein